MEVKDVFDVAVIGAGPAGSAAAITAADRGLHVALLEAGRYPRHKVCGEFVSSESAEVLKLLLPTGPSILANAPRIRTSTLHADGHAVSMPLAEPAYSIPRIQLDDCLWREAHSRGVLCHVLEAKSVHNSGDLFEIVTSGPKFRARVVINASGRWSRITQSATVAEPWIGLKAHFAGETDDVVDLYFMNHGYCGVQAVSPAVLNACALMKQGTAKQLEDVFQADASLLARSRGWKQITETFATAPVYLGLRSPLHEGVLQVGDAAGFVDPFVGDGISLSLRSGVLAGRSVLSCTPDEYAQMYLRAFSGIFRSTRQIRSLLSGAGVFRPWLLQAVRLPGIARRVFTSTRASRLDVLSPTLPRVN